MDTLNIDRNYSNFDIQFVHSQKQFSIALTLNMQKEQFV